MDASHVWSPRNRCQASQPYAQTSAPAPCPASSLAPSSASLPKPRSRETARASHAPPQWTTPPVGTRAPSSAFQGCPGKTCVAYHLRLRRGSQNQTPQTHTTASSFRTARNSGHHLQATYSLSEHQARHSSNRPQPTSFASGAPVHLRT